MLGFFKSGTSLNTRRTPSQKLRSLGNNFDAASFGRLLQKWRASSDGANSAMLGGLVTMRNRSRDLGRNNPWCAGALDSLVSNVTDPGIVPISRHDDAGFKKEMRVLWSDWNEVADAHGLLSWDLMVGLAYRSFLESGEVFVRMRSRLPEDNLPVPLQVQLIEADHVPVDYTTTAPNGNKIIAGIEFDVIGRRVAYWMYPEHPGESVTINPSANLKLVRVPATDIIHLFEPTRPGQVRGIPRLVPVLTRLHDVGMYENAELLKKMMASMMVAWVTTPTPDEPIMGTEDEDVDEDEGANWLKMEPAQINILAPGEEVTFSDPPSTDGNYEAHLKMNLRAVAAVFGLTYEQMTGDLTGVNFSSIRAGLNEFQRRARRSQRLLIHVLCRAVFSRWLDEAVLAGAISAPGYAANPRPYKRIDWRPPGWRYVNPQQEIAAVKEEIKGGLRSRESVLAEQGQDVADVDAQIASDWERSKGLGLIYDTDPDGVDQATKSVNEVAAPDQAASGDATRAAPGRLQALVERKVEALVREQDDALEAAIEKIMGE